MVSPRLKAIIEASKKGMYLPKVRASSRPTTGKSSKPETPSSAQPSEKKVDRS